MHAISIDQAEPGVVLAADVVDRHGRPLLRAGSELTERSIQSLKMWGVRSLSVEGDAPDEPSEAELDDPALRAEAEEVVAARFALVEPQHHPFLAVLRREALTEAARTLARARR